MLFNRNIASIKILTKHNGIIESNSLRELVPQSAYYSDIHVDLCLKIAEDFYPNDLKQKKLYTNLLLRKSTVLMDLVGALFLIQHNQITVETLFLPHQLAALFSNVLLDIKSDMNIVSVPVRPNTYIDQPKWRILFAKYAYHKFYRFLGWKFFLGFKNVKSIVRSYVEVTETLHRDRMPYSLCLFFPFPYKLKRQLEFIKQVKKKGYTTSFFGMPYPFSTLMQILFYRSDKFLVTFDLSAYQKHAEELLKNTKINEYYTEDEYDAASFILNETLKSKNCNVTNSAHGFGVYCPFIDCSTFEFLTTKQMQYYKKWNTQNIIKYKIQKRELLPETEIVKSYHRVCFIFIHSNFKDHNIFFEDKFQEKVIHILEKNNDNYDIRIKYHPNAKDIMKTSLKSVSLDEIQSMDKLKVFFTLQSTAFYTYCNYGPFVFIGDALCNPFHLFDTNIPFYLLEDITEVLKKYNNRQSVIDSLKKQQLLFEEVY